MHLIGVANEYAWLCNSQGIPQLRGVVGTAGKYLLTVRREGHSIYHVGMADERAQFLAGCQCPQPRSMVGTASEHIPAIG